MNKKKAWCLLLFFGFLLLSACAGPNHMKDMPKPGSQINQKEVATEGGMVQVSVSYQVDERWVAGFWSGLWHGIICPISFIGSLFSDGIHFYETHNNGGWYNFGFVLGAGILFGGGGSSSRRKK